MRAFAGRFGVVLVMAVGGLAGPGVAQAQGSRVAVIVMENEPYGNIVGNGNAPYINSLIGSGKRFSNYWSLKSGSLPDYLAMTSGLLATLTPPSPNVFQAIDASGGAVTWKSFQESMGGNCGVQSGAKVPGTTANLYARIHDPAYQYRGNTTCSTHDVPMTILVTWDEGNSTTKHVVTLEVGAGVTPGSSDSTRYNHYSLEAGLYRKFNLGTAPNNGATATPLPIP